MAAPNNATRRGMTMDAQYAEFQRITQSGDYIDLPYRLEPFGENGYTVARMTPEQAAVFVSRHRNAEMPCWSRFETINGRLTLTH